MGLLDRLFGPSHKVYSLDEAMELIEKDLLSAEAKNQEESYQSSLKIHWEMQQLSTLIDEFSLKPAPESARSSAAVKERFCGLSKKQLESLDAPTKDDHSFPHNARLIMNNLGGLTHRQLLHINFFFKEDFKPIAKKINEINALFPAARSGDKNKALVLYKKIKGLGERKKTLHDSILVNEENLSQLKSKQLPPLAQEPDNYGLNMAETKLRNLKQEIDSFLAVQKLLKKYDYIQKIGDEMLTLYVESPSSALMHDDSLKIMSFISEASSLAKEGKIDADFPEKKIQSILNSSDYLGKKRIELLGAAALMKEEKGRYGQAKERFEASLHARTNELAELEGEVKHTSKLIESAKKEESEIGAELARTRAELCLLASKILDANVS